MHLLSRGEVGRRGEKLVVDIHGGDGSAPDLVCELEIAGREGASPDENDVHFPDALRAVFPTYAAFLAYIVPQNRALATQPHKHTFTRQEIALPIPEERCVPLRGPVTSRAARLWRFENAPSSSGAARGSRSRYRSAHVRRAVRRS